MTPLTAAELREAQASMKDGLSLPVTINGVTIFDAKILNSLGFRYGNASGLIFTDNGYLGSQPGGKNYYLLWKLSCRYSDECRFNPSFEPNLDAAASAVIESWNLFTGRIPAVVADSG